MTMVDQIAKALFEHTTQKPWAGSLNQSIFGTRTPTWELVCSPAVAQVVADEYRAQARAALKAMRNVQVSTYNFYDCNRPWAELSSVEVLLKWIDAALKESSVS